MRRLRDVLRFLLFPTILGVSAGVGYGQPGGPMLFVLPEWQDIIAGTTTGTEGQVIEADASGLPVWGTPAGTGDMLKSTYDTGEDGTVDAVDAGAIDESMLDVSNSPTDNYVLSYNEAGTNFTWVANAGGGFDATTVDDETWSDGANGSNTWTFDVSGTDTTMTFGDDRIDLETSVFQVDGASSSNIHFTDTDTGSTSSDGVLAGLNSSEDFVIYSQESTNDFRVYLGGSYVFNLKDNGDLDFIQETGRAFIHGAESSNSNPTFSFYNDTNTGIYQHAANVLGVTADGTTRLYVSDTGNGWQVVPEDWKTSQMIPVQYGGLGAIAGDAAQSAGSDMFMMTNAYYDTTDSRWEYIVTDEATLYQQGDGVHQWYYAASGTADTEITWARSLRQDPSGGLIVGASLTTADDLLHIYGGSAGSVTAHASARLVIEDDDDAWIQFLTPNSNNSGLFFGDDADPDNGYVGYNHSTLDLSLVAADDVVVNAGGTDALTVESAGVTLGSDGADGKLIIHSEQGGTDYTVAFEPHATMTETTSYTLPPADGSSGQVLHTDGSGNLTWDSDDGAGGGAPTDAQYLVSASNASLSAEDVVTEGFAIDYTNGAGTGTFAFDPTEITGGTTWDDGGEASVVWTWNLTAGDPSVTFGSGYVNISGGTLQEGGNAVYNASETPGGELGGTWASPTIDDSISVSGWTIANPTLTGTLTATDLITTDHFTHSTDWGEVSTNGSGNVVLDADVVGTAEMADEDHGDVAWSGGTATVQTVDSTAAADLAKATGDVYSGVHNMGGATTLEVPNATGPSTTAEGMLAWDTDDDALEVYDGSNSVLIPSVKTASATIFDPDGVQATQDALPLLAVHADSFPHGITIKDIHLAADSSNSGSYNLEEWTSPTDGSPSTIEAVSFSSSTEASDDGTLSDASVAAGSYVFIDLDTTALNFLNITITFTVNEGS